MNQADAARVIAKWYLPKASWGAIETRPPYCQPSGVEPEFSDLSLAVCVDQPGSDLDDGFGLADDVGTPTLRASLQDEQRHLLEGVITSLRASLSKLSCRELPHLPCSWIFYQQRA